jgi:chromatin remodeling complex protein RSC6
MEESIHLVNQFQTIMDHLSQCKVNITNIQQEIKTLEKGVKKQMKNVKKEVKHKGNRKPSGFAKPTKVTKELCEFMNKEEGTEIARTEVTKSLIDYIKLNELQNKENT